MIRLWRDSCICMWIGWLVVSCCLIVCCFILIYCCCVFGMVFMILIFVCGCAMRWLGSDCIVCIVMECEVLYCVVMCVSCFVFLLCVCVFDSAAFVMLCVDVPGCWIIVMCRDTWFVISILTVAELLVRACWVLLWLRYCVWVADSCCCVLRNVGVSIDSTRLRFAFDVDLLLHWCECAVYVLWWYAMCVMFWYAMRCSNCVPSRFGALCMRCGVKWCCCSASCCSSLFVLLSLCCAVLMFVGVVLCCCVLRCNAVDLGWVLLLWCLVYVAWLRGLLRLVRYGFALVVCLLCCRIVTCLWDAYV